MSPPAIAAAVAAVLALSLSGCGGSDDDPVDPDDPVEHREYDEQQALLHANLCTASNCGRSSLGHDRALESWSCGPPCDAIPDMKQVRVIESGRWDDAYAYVGRLGSDCVLAFRGTSQIAGWIKDLQSGTKVKLDNYGINCSYGGEPCRVGQGFVQNYAHLAEHIRGNLTEIDCDTRPLIVTGHSLGAAEASIAMLDLKHRGYTLKPTYLFGGPRVGDSAFVGAFNSTFSHRQIFRVTHYKDPVPHLPPSLFGFQHLPTEVYYGKGDESAGFAVCDASGEDPLCAGQWGNTAAMITVCVTLETTVGGCDHLTYMAASMNHSMNGDSCTDGSAPSASSKVLI